MRSVLRSRWLVFLCICITISEVVCLDNEKTILDLLKTHSDEINRLNIELKSVQSDNMRLNDENKALKKELAMVDNRLMHVENNRNPKRQLQGSTPIPIVAFTAVLTHPVKLGQQQTIIFDKVIMNKGNAYDVRHGEFNAPVNGIYLLSVSLLTSVQATHAELVSDGTQLVAMYGQNDNALANTIVVELNAGQHIWVRQFGTVV